MTGQPLKKFGNRLALALAALLVIGAPASAQIQSIDPNEAIDADLGTPPAVETAPPAEMPADASGELPAAPSADSDAAAAAEAQSTTPPLAVPKAGDPSTYQYDDLIGEAEGIFGKGSQGLAKMIEDILKKQGEPNGYIVGREGGGALIVGLRYGSGTLHHKVEGQQPVYWTGPSVGYDAGASAGSTFVLVYNLYDTEDLYRRFPSGEGVAYLIGGFNASYLRRGDIVLIPIRVGAGLRLGANVGYMKFSKKQRWLPF